MSQRVVVTGMGAVCSVGATFEDMWSAIRAGKSGIRTIEAFDPVNLTCKIAGEIPDFDPGLYMDVKAAKRMARCTQLGVAAATMAWKHAGLGERAGDVADPDRCAVIVGNGIGGNEVDSEAHKRLVERGANRIPALTIPKVIVNEVPGNISMILGTMGRAHALVTACASGTDAIGTALDMIRLGRADLVVTGGSEHAATEYGIGSFCALKALSTAFNDEPKRASRPFDRDRDGFVMGEGAGILILESLDHAINRGAKIYAEVAGYGASADAFHLTAPDPEGAGAAKAIREALRDADMAPEDIDYINAHGTSTPINDPVETRAIRTAFGKHAYELKVSSTKGMMGHCLGAAGGLEAIVAVLALRDQFFPATLNLDNPDPECDLDYVPHVGREGKIEAVVSTSLGFGGHNGVLVIRKYT